MAFGYRRVFWLLFGIASFFFTLHLGLLLNVFFFLLPFFLRIVDWLLFH